MMEKGGAIYHKKSKFLSKNSILSACMSFPIQTGCRMYGFYEISLQIIQTNHTKQGFVINLFLILGLCVRYPIQTGSSLYGLHEYLIQTGFGLYGLFEYILQTATSLYGLYEYLIQPSTGNIF